MIFVQLRTGKWKCVMCSLRWKLYYNQKNSFKFSWRDSKLSFFYKFMHKSVTVTFFSYNNSMATFELIIIPTDYNHRFKDVMNMRFFLNARHLRFTCSVLLPSRKIKNKNKETMYFMPPIFHFLLIWATAKCNSETRRTDGRNLLRRKQKEVIKTDPLELMNMSDT